MTVTTIEESKKLLELGVDPSTADMSWYQPNIMYPYELHTKYKGHGVMADRSDNLIPAWSLSALLELMPSDVSLSKGAIRLEPYEELPDRWCCDIDDVDKNIFHTTIEDMPLKAVYKMVVWLKENKYI